MNHLQYTETGNAALPPCACNNIQRTVTIYCCGSTKEQTYYIHRDSWNERTLQQPTGSPVTGFQSQSMPSMPPLTSSLASGDHAKHSTQFLCPCTHASPLLGTTNADGEGMCNDCSLGPGVCLGFCRVLHVPCDAMLGLEVGHSLLVQSQISLPLSRA